MADENAVSSKVNLDDLDSSLVQEDVELNPESNPMEDPPPVSDGTHRIKLVMKEDSWEHKTTKENAQTGKTTDYLACQFYGIVIAEGSKDNNKRVFDRANTLAFDGKNVMAHILLQIYGGKKNEEAKEKIRAIKKYTDLAKAFQNALAAEPIIKVATKWTARYNAGTTEKANYQTALSGQNNFPSDGAGGRRPVVVVKGVGEVKAQAIIQDYFPDAV